MGRFSKSRFVFILLFLPIFLSLSYSNSSASQPGKIQLVKNINPGDWNGSYPQPYLTYQGDLYFTAEDYTYGRELWKTDGTPAGTVRLKDINVGEYSNIGNLTIFQDKIYFWATDSGYNKELWVTDGSTEGTVLFKNINPGGSSDGAGLTVFDGKLYFAADDGANGRELWVSDGTVEGTEIFQNINPTPSTGSSPGNFTVFNGELYFIADDGANGLAFWKTDGTLGEATIAFKFSDKSLTSVGNITNADDKLLYFPADDGTNGRELWKSDGTLSGTNMVKNINPSGGSYPHIDWNGRWPLERKLPYLNGKIYFMAFDSAYGIEVWTSDGTPGGTIRLTDKGGGGNDPIGLTIFNNKIFFTAYDPTNGYELWETDGTPAGTHIFFKINEGFHSPAGMIGIEDHLYFNVFHKELGASIWKTDGTAEGTVFVDYTNYDSGVDRFHNSNSTLFLMSAIPSSIGHELYKVVSYPEIFSDNFESGDFSAWSSKTGSIVAINKAAMKKSNFGAAVKVLNKKPKFLLDNSPNNESLYFARFYLDMNSLKMANKNNFILFQGRNGKQKPFQFKIRKYNKKYWIQPAIRTDSGKMLKTKWKRLPNKPTAIEVGWKRADSSINRNGYIKLWINGVEKASVLKVNNDKLSLDQIRIGVAKRIKVAFSISGKFFIDSFESNNVKFIGP